MLFDYSSITKKRGDNPCTDYGYEEIVEFDKMVPTTSSDGLMTDLAVKDKKEKRKTRSSGSGTSGNLKLLFWIAVCIQIIDVFLLQFDRTVYFPTAIGMYGALTLLAIWFFSKEEGHLTTPRQIILFILISFFYLIVPTLLYAIPDIDVVAGTTLFDWVGFLLAILPIWPIYIGMKAEYAGVHKYVNFWIIFLLFVFIFGIGFKLSPAFLGYIGGRSETIQVGIVANYLWDETGDVVKNFWTSIKKLFDVTSLPIYNNTMGYYMSEIERSNGDTKNPVGLYLDDVKAVENYFYKGTPAIIWANIRGKSFMDEIHITPECYIDKVGDGVPSPKSYTLYGFGSTSFSCTFNDLEKGDYTARVGVTFNFETWAYVTYTFVNLETQIAMSTQGKNINSELDIPLRPRAISTRGPVMVGMAPTNLEMPIGIDTKFNTQEPILGVTIDNLWTNGKIDYASELIIMVPDDFKLVRCDRWYPATERAPDESENGVDIYKFKREEIGDVRQTFKSVRCWVHIKDPVALLSGAQKVERTFVAAAKYQYRLEEREGIHVRE